MTPSTPRRRIVVTRTLIAPLLDRLRATCEAWINTEDRTLAAEEIIRQATALDAEALLVMSTDRVDAALITALPPTVRVIATYSLGFEHIALDAARARGIAVVRVPDVLSEAVADMAMLLLLGAARRAWEGAALLYGRQWRGWTPTQILGRDVHGARLGILGMGRIGRAIARRAGRGFDMAVHYHNRSRLPAELEAGATHHPTAHGLFAASDFLVLAAPSSPATRRILNAAALARLPKGATVVNIARGDLVDDEALIAALGSGQVGAAGLDVFNNEPALHPEYLRLPNVFLQPHQGSSTVATRLRMGETLIDSIERLLAGEAVAERLV
jgi:glyoxylate reductase